MKVLMFTIDASAYTPGSSFRKRLSEYAKLLEELHVVVTSPCVNGEEKIGENTWLYPAGSSKLFMLFGSYRRGAALLHGHEGRWVMTAQEEFTGAMAYMLSRRLGIPWQAELHTDVFSTHFGRGPFKNKVRKILARVLLPRASRIRVVSNRIKRSLEKQEIRIPVTLLPISIKREIYTTLARERSYKASGDNLRYLMISRLTREKNITLALDALSEMSHGMLTIVGDGSERARLMRHARARGIDSRVSFEGERSDILPYLQAADVFLATSWYEGYGIAPLEAALSGLPVIMTDVGIAGDLIRDGISGCVIPPGDRRALISVMKRMEEETFRKRIGQGALGVSDRIVSKEMYLAQWKESLEACLEHKHIN